MARAVGMRVRSLVVLPCGWAECHNLYQRLSIQITGVYSIFFLFFLFFLFYLSFFLSFFIFLFFMDDFCVWFIY